MGYFVSFCLGLLLLSVLPVCACVCPCRVVVGAVCVGVCVCVVCSYIVSVAASSVPHFFYNLTSIKHTCCVRVFIVKRTF